MAVMPTKLDCCSGEIEPVNDGSAGEDNTVRYFREIEPVAYHALCAL